MPGAFTPAAWWPTVDSVAALLRARTRVSGYVGMTTGTFTDQTTPTASQVEELIEIAAGEMAVLMRGAEPCNDLLEQQAARATAYRVAQLVELSLSPETSNDEDSAARSFERLAKEQMTAIGSLVATICPVGPEFPAGMGHVGVSGRVPSVLPIGLGTRL